MLYRLMLTLLLFLAMVTISTAGPDMKEGKWEITMKMEMPGMPMEMPPFTHTQCLTKRDFVPDDAQQQGNGVCEKINVKTSGNTVTWSTRCKSEEGTAVGSGKITYSGKAFSGFMQVKQSGMQMKTTMKGKYIGSCD